MDDIIHFAEYTYTPKVWTSLNYDNIIKKLPSSKQILSKLNEYFNEYPEFHLKLRTNLWRIHTNPANILGNALPIDIWNEIDSYLNEPLFLLLIQKCKLYYIIAIQTQIDDEIKRYLKLMRDNTNNHLFYYAKHTVEHYKRIQRNINDYKDTYLLS
jgi:hypothetical protein